MNDTTKRFARGTAEAFESERREWWYPPLRNKPRRWPLAALVVIGAIALAAAAYLRTAA